MKRKLITLAIISLIACNFNCLAQNVVSVYLPEPCTSVDIQETPNSLQLDFKISPNPNDGRFSISLENAKADNLKVNIQILDIMGRMIYNDDYSLRNGQYEFNNFKLTAGIYYFRLQNEKLTSVKMFIVQ
jgi:hypothetical protein